MVKEIAVKDTVRMIIVNFYLLIVGILLYPLILVNQVLYRRKKGLFTRSLITRILDKSPRIYEYSLLVWNFPIMKRIYRPIQINTADSILQVGCGTGIFNKCFAEEKFEITNLDINENYLDYGMKKKRFDAQKVMNESVYDINCEAESFDLILFARCFHHIRHQKKALNECSRVLKKEGIIVIYDPVSTAIKSHPTQYTNTLYDGMIYNYHKDTFKSYIKNICPNSLILEELKYYKNFTVTNYNLKYPHVDAYVILKKFSEL